MLDLGLDSTGIRLLHEILKDKVKKNPNLGLYIVSHKSPEGSFIDNDEEVGKVVFERHNGFTSLKSMKAPE